MFHLLCYSRATGGSVTAFDLNAVTDPEITQRNNHYTFTEDYQLLAAGAYGPNLSEAYIYVPRFNQVTRFNIWNLNLSGTIPSPPRFDWYVPDGIPISRYEEFQIQVNDSASEQPFVFLWIGTHDWTRNIPSGIPPLPRFKCRVTATVTPGAYSWGTLASLTFEQVLLQGTYAVVGSVWQGANLLAVREVYPKQKLYGGRKLRPGIVGQNGAGDILPTVFPYQELVFGEHGRFATFEPFQIEAMSTATTQISVVGILTLVRVSESQDVTY